VRKDPSRGARASLVEAFVKTVRATEILLSGLTDEIIKLAGPKNTPSKLGFFGRVGVVWQDGYLEEMRVAINRQ
jgi:hypothetical protein